eukprot:2537806-Rhodomonas_salina.2
MKPSVWQLVCAKGVFDQVQDTVDARWYARSLEDKMAETGEDTFVRQGRNLRYRRLVLRYRRIWAARKCKANLHAAFPTKDGIGGCRTHETVKCFEALHSFEVWKLTQLLRGPHHHVFVPALQVWQLRPIVPLN